MTSPTPESPTAAAGAQAGAGDPAADQPPAAAAEEEAGGDGPIRVLLAGLPELLAGVVAQAVGSETDMLLVGHARDHFELLLLAGEGADVLVLGATPVHPLPRICGHLLAELPQLKILVVDPAGTGAMRYWVAVQEARTTIGTRRRLVGSIRALARQGFDAAGP